MIRPPTSLRSLQPQAASDTLGFMVSTPSSTRAGRYICRAMHGFRRALGAYTKSPITDAGHAGAKGCAHAWDLKARMTRCTSQPIPSHPGHAHLPRNGIESPC